MPIKCIYVDEYDVYQILKEEDIIIIYYKIIIKKFIFYE